MRLSEDKISHLSHLLCEGAQKEQLIQARDPSLLLRMTKKILWDYCQREEAVDEIVRKKLRSYSRKIVEGSREWDILYRKHFEEEMKKQ